MNTRLPLTHYPFSSINTIVRQPDCFNSMPHHGWLLAVAALCLLHNGQASMYKGSVWHSYFPTITYQVLNSTKDWLLGANDVHFSKNCIMFLVIKTAAGTSWSASRRTRRWPSGWRLWAMSPMIMMRCAMTLSLSLSLSRFEKRSCPDWLVRDCVRGKPSHSELIMIMMIIEVSRGLSRFVTLPTAFFLTAERVIGMRRSNFSAK